MYTLGTSESIDSISQKHPGYLLQINTNPANNFFFQTANPTYTPDETIFNLFRKSNSLESRNMKNVQSKDDSKTTAKKLSLNQIENDRPMISKVNVTAIIEKVPVKQEQYQTENIKSPLVEINNNPGANYFPAYKNSPLFTDLKNNLIKCRPYTNINEDGHESKDTATLILKPQALAVAGLKGTAMATPLARAIIEKGTDVDIYFEPHAVAIAGPGGIAHAQSELEIGYREN